MSVLVLLLEMDLELGAGWEVRTDDLRGFSTKRGRERETETIGAGTAELVLDGRAGAYDIDLHPEVGPGLLARLSALVDTGVDAFTFGSSAMGSSDAFGGGDTYRAIFVGRSEGATETYPGGKDEVVVMHLVDGSKRLNRDQRDSGLGTTQLSGARVNELLDSTTPPWLADERAVDAGQRTVQGVGLTSDRLSYLHTVATSEGGRFFIGSDGKATFRDSAYLSPKDVTPFGDLAGEQRYRDIVTEPDDRSIANAITVTAPSLADQTAEDLDSQTRYGRVDLSVATFLSTTAEMDILADDIVSKYAVPRRRIVSLVLGTRDTDWNSVLAKDIGDRIDVRRRPIYGGLQEQESVIEGIAVSSPNLADWTLTWSLSSTAVSNPNLLTANQSGIEVDASGWVAEANCTLTVSTTHRITGTQSLQADVTAVTANFRTTPTTATPVTVGVSYTGKAWMMNDYPYGQWRLVLSWRDAGGAELSTSTGSIVNLVYFFGARQLVVTGVAPASAAFVCLRAEATGIGGPGAFYLDAASIREV